MNEIGKFRGSESTSPPSSYSPFDRILGQLNHRLLLEEDHHYIFLGVSGVVFFFLCYLCITFCLGVFLFIKRERVMEMSGLKSPRTPRMNSYIKNDTNGLAVIVNQPALTTPIKDIQTSVVEINTKERTKRRLQKIKEEKKIEKSPKKFTRKSSKDSVSESMFISNKSLNRRVMELQAKEV